ncbi:MAG TPA: signal peptidase I [Steroidobacteraceae bacterium]|nr:signal peptidase I [Steroidobacteraceae bacterium]
MPIIPDFSLLLVVLALLTGVIWGLDQRLWRPGRAPGAREPVLVEYSRSFFPIILIVLVVRSFLFEPFRIPSDSMMPTLLDGDFIFVSKFSYGLRLPVLNVKVLNTGEPARGDVIVFRKPSEPSVNYIKRLVGLPGDRIEVRGDAVWVNGEEIKVQDDGLFTEDLCYRNFRQGIEQLGAHRHRIMYCPVEPRRYMRGCTPKRDANECGADPARAAGPAGDAATAPTGVYTVPDGQYFFMGDNRDNSADSRFPELGYVPEANLVGKAVRIWLSFNGSAGPAWGRIGKAIR